MPANQDAIRQITEMGFGEDEAARALEVSTGQRAIAILFLFATSRH
jgi:uncharacterized UBP type Zn finger protein